VLLIISADGFIEVESMVANGRLVNYLSLFKLKEGERKPLSTLLFIEIYE
jgi:hypothetical protein